MRYMIPSYLSTLVNLDFKVCLRYAAVKELFSSFSAFQKHLSSRGKLNSDKLSDKREDFKCDIYRHSS